MASKEHYEPLMDYGEHMPMEDFVRACEHNLYTDYDGSGCYATETMILRGRDLRPSDVKNGTYDKSFKFMVWFNK